MMPSFNYITNEEKEAIISYLFNLKEEKEKIYPANSTTRCL